MKRTVLSCLAAVSAVAASFLFFYAFPIWVPPLYCLSVALYAFAAGVIAWLFTTKKPLMKALIAAAAYAGGFLSLTFLVNNVILHADQSVKATVILSGLNLVFFIVYYAVVSRGKKRRRALAACAFLLAALPVVSYLFTICVPFSGRVRSVVGSTDATPVTATERAHRFDDDRLLLGAYCLTKDANYETLRRWFTEEQLATMRDAVEDHRASSKHPPRTIYGAIVAEADRQIDPKTVIRRTMAYSAKLFPDGDFETLFQRSKEHLQEKYGEGGYLKLWLNSERNVRGLEELRAIIRDEEKLRELAKGD